MDKMYEQGDILETFDVNEYWAYTMNFAEEIVFAFGGMNEISRDDLQEAVNDLCDELSRVIFDDAYSLLNDKDVAIKE